MIHTRITRQTLEAFTTEQCNPGSLNIDTMSVTEILRLINNEDKSVATTVSTQLPVIAALVEDIVCAFRKEARLVYIGAGTSGRLGVLDASECPPTFGVPPGMVRGLIAGGREALVRSIEDAEDNATAGRQDLEEINFSKDDVLVGVTASGHAPYVLSALEHARSMGAVVGAISCNRGSKTFEHAHHCICLEVGPEVLTGSTRMKAGTAQKMVLNMLTTASMIRIGKVYRNLMVDLTPVNRKLVDRSIRLIWQATGCSEQEAEEVFLAAGRRPKTAILMVLLDTDCKTAEALLDATEGSIAAAVQAYHKVSRG